MTNKIDVEGVVEEFDHITYPPLAGNPLQNRTDEELIERHDFVVNWLRTTLTTVLTQAEEEKKREIQAYQVGISKIASELRKAGFAKTADKIDSDLELLKQNPTVENVLSDTPTISSDTQP